MELNPKTTSVPPNSTIIPVKHWCKPEHLCELLWLKLSDFTNAKFKEILLYKASLLGKFRSGILIQRGILFLSYHWKRNTKFSSQLHNWKFTEPEQQRGCDSEYSHPRSSMLFPVSKTWFKCRDPAPYPKHYIVTLLLVPSHGPKHQVVSLSTPRAGGSSTSPGSPGEQCQLSPWRSQEQTSPGSASRHGDGTVKKMHVPVTYS